MDFTIIKHAVRVDEGIKRFSMQFIKSIAAPDRKRLSAELCEQIRDELDKLGLVTLPRRIPTSETDSLWIIERDSEMGELVLLGETLARFRSVGVPPVMDVLDQFPKAGRAVE